MVIVQCVPHITKMKIFADRMMNLDITVKFTTGIQMLIRVYKGKWLRHFLVANYRNLKFRVNRCCFFDLWNYICEPIWYTNIINHVNN